MDYDLIILILVSIILFIQIVQVVWKLYRASTKNRESHHRYLTDENLFQTKHRKID
jgi:hypothetical protein